jgi:nicotinamide-nucleotide amidase
MIKSAILAIGDEILEGSIVDTNSAYLASKISKLGVKVVSVQAVPDELDIIVDMFEQYMSECDVVLVTGGLGPTFDDLTAEAASKVINCSTVFYQEIFDSIRNKLESRGVDVKDSHKKQAMLPERCTLYPNPVGTAYGFSIEKHNAFLFAMPGVPYEMEAIFDTHIFPFIKNYYDLSEFYSLDLKFNGIPESDVDDVITKTGIPDGMNCIINVSKGDIIVRLRSWDRKQIDDFADILRKELYPNFVGYGKTGIEMKLFNVLKERDFTFSTAESCTGGLIAKKITDLQGSSEVFLGTVVAYSNKIKENVLGIDKNTLIEHGAVSSATAEDMSVNVAEIMGSDVSVATTGIAGPTGGTPEKPVGTVYIAVNVCGKITVKHYVLHGDRDTVRERTAKNAIRLAFEEVLKVV